MVRPPTASLRITRIRIIDILLMGIFVPIIFAISTFFISLDKDQMRLQNAKRKLLRPQKSTFLYGTFMRPLRDVYETFMRCLRDLYETLRRG